MSDPRTPPTPTLTRTARWVFTITAGLTVANLYYNQPLLADIARSFGVATARVGIIATLTQIGYAIGLLLIVPLGDITERRRLITLTLVGVTVALAIAAGARNFALFAFASLLVGAATITPQIIVPLAAGLAQPAERGTVVGQIMSGLLVGILGGRVIAGIVGGWLGWRMVFVLAAAVMLALAVIVPRWLPRTLPSSSASYRALLRSLGPIVRDEPVVRDAALLGALAFASFSAFWTTLVFRLQLAPLHYGSAVAGSFGLLGIAGALAAPVAGRLADRVSPRRTVGIVMVVNAVGWIVAWLAGSTIVGLAATVVLLDAGTQAAHISNQARIYARPAVAHSRYNTVYMVTYFVGGAAGSVLGAWAFNVARWTGVCVVGIGFITIALGILAIARPERAMAERAR